MCVLVWVEMKRVWGGLGGHGGWWWFVGEFVEGGVIGFEGSWVFR